MNLVLLDINIDQEIYQENDQENMLKYFQK